MEEWGQDKNIIEFPIVFLEHIDQGSLAFNQALIDALQKGEYKKIFEQGPYVILAKDGVITQ